MLCLELTEKGVRENLNLIERNRDRVSMAELGIVSHSEIRPPEVERLIAESPLPVVVADYGTEGEATDILLAAARRKAAYVETADEETAEKIARSDELREGGGRLVRRLYFSGGPPADLRRRAEAARAGGAVVKVAAELRGTADALRFVRAAEELSGIEEKILVGEGEPGLFTRILYRRFGSLWTYALDERSVREYGSAPGRGRVEPSPAPSQAAVPTLEELAEVYRAEEIGAGTKILGIIGNPVAHSRSPLIHNGWLREAGLQAVYLPFLVDDPKAFFRLAEALPVDGFSVTVPHKEAVISELDEVDGVVKKIGACNTVYRGPRGWHGTNTDYEGFLAPLEGLIGRGAIRNCLVIGAGGAARTAVHALNDRAVEVSVCNRTVGKAERLAAEVGGRALSLEQAAESGPYDLIVQTTSIGMEPHPEDEPLPSYRFSGAETVYDIIYTPAVTRFMQRAREGGCATIGGAEMLRTQAQAQFCIFTGGSNPRVR